MPNKVTACTVNIDVNTYRRSESEGKIHNGISILVHDGYDEFVIDVTDAQARWLCDALGASLKLRKMKKG